MNLRRDTYLGVVFNTVATGDYPNNVTVKFEDCTE